MAMLTVGEARARVLADVMPLGIETLKLGTANGRTLAAPVMALRTQPPQAVSAMDGYALRSADAFEGARLAVIGAAPAGLPFDGSVGAGEAVRIFTGGVVPEGADAVIIQENVEATNLTISLSSGAAVGANIRPAGIDFREGDMLLAAGTRLTPRALGLVAAANHPHVMVHRRPRFALIATGDELRQAGSHLLPGQIIASSGVMVAAMAEAEGAEVIDFGIIADDRNAIGAAIAMATRDGADIIVTLGGASVGEHDLVKDALADQGVALDFWKIAMRPGKPLMLGRKGETRLLGLPGNPVSSFVCAELFLKPLIAALQGRVHRDAGRRAVLAAPLPANGPRGHYLRARITGTAENGLPLVEAFPDQDSSLLAVLAAADCLIVQEAGSGGAKTGEACTIIMI
ncbi:MAG: molybdopterin molybdotransferase MoeA [Rhizobiaceae bacterium]|jgi:molybdopterin molybdotransferase|nr:molybdopterin molybdotransferase MoeA [Rhizobiaceae bacterium]